MQAIHLATKKRGMCTAQHCTAQHCTALYCTTLYSTDLRIDVRVLGSPALKLHALSLPLAIPPPLFGPNTSTSTATATAAANTRYSHRSIPILGPFGEQRIGFDGILEESLQSVHF